MKKILILIFVVPFYGLTQTGTLVDPFTTIGQALTVPSAGIYYFNLSGTTFDTYVDANGYIQVAIDFGNGTGNLPQGTSLTTASRGILSTTVLSNLTAITEVRISSNTGNIDVLTTNSTILTRVVNNQTIHRGNVDNGINNLWTGTNALRLTANASCYTSLGASLHQNIIHVCGNNTTFNWIPSGNYQRERWNFGEIANSVSFHLWVRDNSSPLPIELVNFNAEQTNNNFVKLNWQTASEINNDFFSIERSENGMKWEVVSIIEGAGNSSNLLHYSHTDENPHIGVSYYRLKQTDFDGQFEYSQIRSINIERLENSDVILYPNPTKNQISIEGDEQELTVVRVYNVLGQDVSNTVTVIKENKRTLIVDLSNLTAGLYYLKTKTTANKVYKQ